MNEVFVWVVLGYEKQDNDSLNKEIYGVYSTEDLANECVEYITKELEYIDHAEIERVLLDEFGFR